MIFKNTTLQKNWYTKSKLEVKKTLREKPFKLSLQTIFFLIGMAFPCPYAQSLHHVAWSDSSQEPFPALKVSTQLRGTSGEILGIFEKVIVLALPETERNGKSMPKPAQYPKGRIGDLTLEFAATNNSQTIIVKLQRSETNTPGSKLLDRQQTYLLSRGKKLLTIVPGKKQSLDVVLQFGAQQSSRESSQNEKENLQEKNAKPGQSDFEAEPDKKELDSDPQIEFKKIERWQKLREWPRNKEPKVVRA